MATAISVHNLTVCVKEKGLEKQLLSNINFAVKEGAFVAVIGASGCGKSTLIKALAGLLKPTRGEVLFAGRDVADLDEALPLAVGYFPQFGAFHDEFTVEENMETAVRLRLPKEVAPERKEKWLHHVTSLARIGPFLPQAYKTLSGGQMRRMALAEELVGDPAFLLLDELTNGLDAFSDQEMMAWLKDLAHEMNKTVVLVTHSTNHLDYCDAILFLHKGRLIHYGDYASLLEAHQVSSIAELFGIYATQEMDLSCYDQPQEQPTAAAGVMQIKSLPPPSGWGQVGTLLTRQAKLFLRDKGQIILHLALLVTFPFLVAVFAMNGLPQVRSQTLALETNILQTLQEQLFYLKESLQAASLISGLAMFQVILLMLTGANNGAREIAKERGILAKELRAGLSPTSYVLVKFLQITVLSLAQAFWMAWFVKAVCGFPGSLLAQFAILFATTLAMSTTCLAISAASPSSERASLLAIYLVGFQLPLSGAALALPEWLSFICRPFIVAYWGWSGYLQTFRDTRYYEIFRQSAETGIALALHIAVALFAAICLTGRVCTHGTE